MTLSGTSLARKRGTTQPRAVDLLAWYDRHRRNLPWRAKPGETPDPYRVWLSEIMLQQTTVRAVAPYYARFLERFPKIEQLAAAELSDVLKLWAGLGYYARARNLHACAKVVVERHGGQFPRTLAELAELPGLGPYTAAAIAAIAFDAHATPVDGNVERVITRLFAREEELPAAKPVIRELAESLTPDARTGDFAQALMDLGATICTPKKPACALCPWNAACAAFRRGDAESFPRKAAKPEGTLRRDTFTHFPLELTVYRAEVPPGTAAPEGTRFLPLPEVAGEAFPNLMRKVLASAGIDPRPADPPGRSPRRGGTHR